MEFQMNEMEIKEGSNSEQPRVKTSDRMHYEAQVQVIKRQLGELENIRTKLGLSQRKISQLLMVDPSAWTRWTRKGEQAPPHIYRALQWYMTLQEKIPGLTPQYFIGKDPEVLHQTILQKIQSESLAREQSQSQLLLEKALLEKKVLKLESQVQANRVGFFMLVLAALIMGIALFFRLRS